MNNKIRQQYGFAPDMETLSNEAAIAAIRCKQQYKRNHFEKVYYKGETFIDKQLFSCSARIICKKYNNKCYWFLRSYNTIVACKADGENAVCFGSYSATTWYHVNKAYNSYIRADYITGWTA